MVCHQIVLEACKKDFHHFEGSGGDVGRIIDRGRIAQLYSRSNVVNWAFWAARQNRLVGPLFEQGSNWQVLES